MAPTRVPLAALPTPLHRLLRASRSLGIDLWIKRDDLSGFAGGGNKSRKLEYIIAQALDEGIQTIVSSGSSQSNFLRQLACACHMFDIECAAVTMDLPYDKAAGKPMGNSLSEGGNRVLSGAFGIDQRVVPDDDWEVLFAHAEDLAEQKRAEGKKVMLVPTGGSTAVGAYSFYMAGQELSAQSSKPFDYLIVPTSSGSTHAGLAYFFHRSVTRVVGVSCDPEPDLTSELWRLAIGLDQLTGLDKTMVKEDFDLRLDYVGPGYGVSSEQGSLAAGFLVKEEGILLDPIYSSKAFSGLLDLIKKGEVSGRVLFWHTGGLPTLFAR